MEGIDVVRCNSLVLNSLSIKSAVENEIRQDLCRVLHVLRETLGEVDRLFARCVPEECRIFEIMGPMSRDADGAIVHSRVEQHAHVLNLDLEIVLRSLASSLERHVLEKVGGSAEGMRPTHGMRK